MNAFCKKTPYRVCPYCGAHLDAGEICDCRQETQKKSAAPTRQRNMFEAQADKGALQH